jgi:16S rRNA C967 or C1407 C5-methylase (RsmB/RsmF family)
VNQHKFVGPNIRELSEFSDGLLYPQSLAAMITVRVLDPKPDETIVDVSCAPGGKLSHISQLMNNSGKVFGFDRNPHKIGQTRETVRKLGCRNVVLSIRDSRYLHEDLQDLRADRVLIDPPCSALGLRPKIYDLSNMSRINALADYQKQFIKSAARIVKPGGVIVYSVCTFTPQECEEVVKFAEKECGMQVVHQNPFVGSKGLSSYEPASLLCQRFHPHTHEIGYFIAKFMR